MAETQKEKVGRLQKRREKQQARREQTSDTPEAVAERVKDSKQQPDKKALQELGERSGIFG